MQISIKTKGMVFAVFIAVFLGCYGLTQVQSTTYPGCAYEHMAEAGLVATGSCWLYKMSITVGDTTNGNVTVWDSLYGNVTKAYTGEFTAAGANVSKTYEVDFPAKGVRLSTGLYVSWTGNVTCVMVYWDQ